MTEPDPFLGVPSAPPRFVVQRPEPWDYWRLRMAPETAWEVAEIATGRSVSPPGAYTRSEAERLRQQLELGMAGGGGPLTRPDTDP